MAYNRIRVLIGVDPKGQPVYTQISGSSQDEINDKIVKAYVQSGRIFEFLPAGLSPLNTSISPVQPAGHGFRGYAEEFGLPYSASRI